MRAEYPHRVPAWLRRGVDLQLNLGVGHTDLWQSPVMDAHRAACIFLAPLSECPMGSQGPVSLLLGACVPSLGGLCPFPNLRPGLMTRPQVSNCVYRPVTAISAAAFRSLARQIGSECLIVPDACPGQPTAQRLACLERGSSVP